MHDKNEFGQLLGMVVENWLPRERPNHEIIQGKYCILEPIQIDRHAEKLYAAFAFDNRGESWTYLAYGPFASLNEFSDWITATLSETLLYAILNAETQDPLGVVGFSRINPQHGVLEIGHVHFSKWLKKTPLATEAIYLMLRHVFDKYGYRRCEWKCNNLNEASKRAAERFGFTFEGIFRQNFVFKNRNRDTAWFSILDHEWPKLKARFEKWLSPQNFTPSGKQILKLQEMGKKDE